MKLLDRLKAAKEAMGTHWVLHRESTYPAKRREPGMCETLRPVVAKAIQEGRM